MSVTAEDLKAQVATIRELRQAEANASGHKKAVSEQLEEAEYKMLALLEASGLPSFKCEHGGVTVSHRSSVKIPREPADLLKLKVFLEQRGEVDLVFTPNSAKLNSYWKDSFEEAKRLGKTDFEIPGVDGITITPILSFRSV